MENNIMERYVEFICNEIPTEIKVKLYPINSINIINSPKLNIQQFVNIEILEKYTRSCKLKLIFDKYEIEDIFFMSRHKGPDKLLDEIDLKIEKLVNNTFINDGREDYIEEKYKEYNKKLQQIFNKLPE
jgi:hypothetical protein